MLYELRVRDDHLEIGERYEMKSAATLGIREKDIENWIADHPDILFPNETVLVIGQSISGQSMADVLALDALGNLVIIEIKRDWSDRTTVGQLLDYAAGLHGATFERLEAETRRYTKWEGGGLYQEFLRFIDRDDFPRDEVGRHHRVVIVAPDSDAGLRGIVAWLRDYGVPIEFVAFSLLATPDRSDAVLSIEGVEHGPEIKDPDSGWGGHWIFNTNESYGPGAYEEMFERGVAAIWGYDTGGRTLEGAKPGDVVLAYVNGQGLRAIGRVPTGDVSEGEGVFLDDAGVQRPREFHMELQWEVVLPPDLAVSASEAAEMGYSLPVRTTFGRLWRGQIASRIEREMRRRAGSAG